MNSFDLVVTVAFGSTLSSILITKDIALAEGLLAIALLVALQFGMTWLSVRSSAVNSLIKTAPTLLLKDGRMLENAMKRVRITEDANTASPNLSRIMAPPPTPVRYT